jgi:hypothetical protein
MTVFVERLDGVSLNSNSEIQKYEKAKGRDSMRYEKLWTYKGYPMNEYVLQNSASAIYGFLLNTNIYKYDIVFSYSPKNPPDSRSVSAIIKSFSFVGEIE